MPQLDPSVFSPQIIWLFVSFLILYLILHFKGLPIIGQVLELRHDTIQDDLESADRMREESVALEEAYQQALAEAKAEATAGLNAARDELNASLDARREESAARIAKKLASAEKAIAKAQDSAMNDIETIASETCEAIVSKLIGFAPNKAALQKVVKSEIKAIIG